MKPRTRLRTDPLPLMDAKSHQYKGSCVLWQSYIISCWSNSLFNLLEIILSRFFCRHEDHCMKMGQVNGDQVHHFYMSCFFCVVRIRNSCLKKWIYFFRSFLCLIRCLFHIIHSCLIDVQQTMDQWWMSKFVSNPFLIHPSRPCVTMHEYYLSLLTDCAHKYRKISPKLFLHTQGAIGSWSMTYEWSWEPWKNSWYRQYRYSFLLFWPLLASY